MPQGKKQIIQDEITVLDLGQAFVKVGRFLKTESGISLKDAQFLPAFGQGFFLDPDHGGREQISFSLDRLYHTRFSEQKVRAVATTTRLPNLRVVIAGLKNDTIADFLKFCDQIGIEVVGVVTETGVRWAVEGKTTSQAIDCVMLIGGFDRKKVKRLMSVTQELAHILESALQVPIYFIGCEELLSPVQHAFQGKRQVFLFPDLWPGKKQRDFLPLYMQLQQLLVKRAVQEDSLVARFIETNGVAVDSGFSAILASLAVLTQIWESSVLLIDIGSKKSMVCWSYYQDRFSLPVWAGEPVRDVLFSGSDTESEVESLFGLKVFRKFGLGESVDDAIRFIKNDDMHLLWEGGKEQTFSDRILNHSLYPQVLPDTSDIKWLDALVRGFLPKVWASLPSRFNPRHIVLSGAFFGDGKRLDSFIENVWLEAPPPFSGEIWLNHGPFLSLLGGLSKVEENITAFDLSTMLHHAADYIRIDGKKDRKGRKATIKVELPDQDIKEYTIGEEAQIISWDSDQKAVIRLQPLPRCTVRGYERGEEVVLRTAGGEKGVIIDGR